MRPDKRIFLSPQNKNATIWKYLDFTKFISLLENQSLYFARSDKFNDPQEGYLLTANNKKNIKKQVFLNCWHLNEYESAAMWDIYLKSNEGIAIKTTYQYLQNCFLSKNTVYIGKVKYLDYKKIKPTTKDPFFPFLCKRKSFEHEKEIRALVYLTKNQLKNQNIKGVFVPVNVSKLIKTIYIAPTAEGWIKKLVEAILKKYNLNIKVIKSDLYNNNLF